MEERCEVAKDNVVAFLQLRPWATGLRSPDRPEPSICPSLPRGQSHLEKVQEVPGCVV